VITAQMKGRVTALALALSFSGAAAARAQDGPVNQYGNPFKHTPKERATVGALRALAPDVDTSTTTKAQYRERYLASAGE